MRLISMATAVAVLLAAGSPALASGESSAQQAATLQGRVILDCLVSKDRFLDDCNVVSEEPAGQGLGQRALIASTTLRVKPGTKLRDADGKRLRVKVPVRFDLSDKG